MNIIKKAKNNINKKLYYSAIHFSLLFILIGYFFLSYVILNFFISTLLMSISGILIGNLISEKIFNIYEFKKKLFDKDNQSQRNKLYDKLNNKTFLSKRFKNKIVFQIYLYVLNFFLADIVFICVFLNIKVFYLNVYDFLPDNRFFNLLDRLVHFSFRIVDDFFLRIANIFYIDIENKRDIVDLSIILIPLFILLNSACIIFAKFIKSEENIFNLIKIIQNVNDEKIEELFDQKNSIELEFASACIIFTRFIKSEKNIFNLIKIIQNVNDEKIEELFDQKNSIELEFACFVKIDETENKI